MARKETGVLSRGMRVLLGVSAAALLLAAAMLGVITHDRGAYGRVLAHMQALEPEQAQRALDGVLFFHDAQEADYARLCEIGAQYAAGGCTDAFAALEQAEFPAAFSPAVQALRQAALDGVMTQARQAYADGDYDTALRGFELLCAQRYDGMCGDWLLLARVRSGCTTSALAALYGTDRDAMLQRLCALLPFADGAQALLDNADCAKAFLTGTWRGEDGAELVMTHDGTGYTLRCGLLESQPSGRFFLTDGVYAVGRSEEEAEALLRFAIADADTITVERLADHATFTLRRTA